MVIEQMIKDYLKQVSKGIINLSHQQTRELINIIIDNRHLQSVPVAKLYRYNAVNDSWIFLYSVKTTNEIINKTIIEQLQLGPVYKFYCWELYNENGELQGKIFTVKNQLF